MLIVKRLNRTNSGVFIVGRLRNIDTRFLTNEDFFRQYPSAAIADMIPSRTSHEPPVC